MHLGIVIVSFGFEAISHFSCILRCECLCYLWPKHVLELERGSNPAGWSQAHSSSDIAHQPLPRTEGKVALQSIIVATILIHSAFETADGSAEGAAAHLAPSTTLYHIFIEKERSEDDDIVPATTTTFSFAESGGTKRPSFSPTGD